MPGILQARTLEWVGISFSNAWKWKVKVKSLSRVRLLATSWPWLWLMARVLEWGAIVLSLQLLRRKTWKSSFICFIILYSQVIRNSTSSKSQISLESVRFSQLPQPLPFLTRVTEIILPSRSLLSNLPPFNSLHTVSKQQKTWIKSMWNWNFPSVPVAKTLCSPYRGPGSDPGSGN